MANTHTDQYLENNKLYASGQAIPKPAYPGKQPTNPAKHVAVVACMDARLDVEDLLGLRAWDAHIIRNAGGLVNDDTIRRLIISHHLLNTNEIILIHHTRCGMFAFTDDLLRAGLEGDSAAEKLLGQTTGHAFTSRKWIPTSGPDAATVRGFICHVDTGKLEEVSYPEAMGSIV